MMLPRALLSAAAIFACAPAATTTVTPVPAPVTAAHPRDLLWARTSAEHHAIFVQTFRSAGEKLAQQALGRARGSWAVIVDADETLVDNSEYQRRLHAGGRSFDNDTWNAWVRERAAGALPGATDYLNAVRSLGGRVVVVTNRDEEVCDPTRENLRALGLLVDLVLCRTDQSDKNPRFEAVHRAAPARDCLRWKCCNGSATTFRISRRSISVCGDRGRPRSGCSATGTSCSPIQCTDRSSGTLPVDPAARPEGLEPPTT